MLKKFLAVTAVLAAGAAAFGQHTAAWVQVDNSAGVGDALHPAFSTATHWTYDLQVTNQAPAGRWATANGSFTIDNGSFFDHVINSNGPIQTNAAFPATTFDSVWHGPYGGLLFSPDPIVTQAQLRRAGWGDTGANGGPQDPQTQTVARVTVVLPEGEAATLSWEGVVGLVGVSGTQGSAASIVIPEPATLSLLGLGLVGLIRRR